MNYGNRNASTPYTSADLAQGYLGACAASMGIAIVSRTMVANQLKSLSGARLLILNMALNYIAVASAGFLNCALMRYKETRDGIDITNKTGDVVYGKSRSAGTKAVMQTGFSRAFLPIVPICVPAITVALMMKMRLLPKNNLV